jgi:hypothetical protein
MSKTNLTNSCVETQVTKTKGRARGAGYHLQKKEKRKQNSRK